MEKLLTAEDICTNLGISINTLYQWTHRGKFPSIKVGKHLRFKESDIDTWLKSHQKHC